MCIKLVLVSFTLSAACALVVILHKCLRGVHVLCEALVDEKWRLRSPDSQYYFEELAMPGLRPFELHYTRTNL